MSEKKKVVIIGAGLGGLSAAISAHAAGFAVEIYEKNDKVGGKLNVKTIDGYTFDLGPSIFTLPQIFRDLFERVDRRFEDYVQLQRVAPQWRNFFEDGLVVDLYEERDLMLKELEKLPGSYQKNKEDFDTFLTYARGQYRACEEGYLSEGLDTTWEMMKHYGPFKLWRTMDWKDKMDVAIHKRIENPQMRMIMEYFIKYVGSSAKDAPGYMNMMSLIQFDHGLWYVKDGMYALAEGLKKLISELGIKLTLNAPVSEITRSKRSVSGITLEDGTKVPADYVVSNMEVIPANRELLAAPAKKLKRLSKFAPACSGLVIHLGTDRPHPQLAHHNFFYSKDQNKHFSSVFEKGIIPDDPTLYVVAPTRTDPSKAPEGGDNIKVLPHIPPINPENPATEEDYMALKDRVLEKMERMGITGLRESTVVEDVLTPVDLERMYRSNQGSIYGVVTNWEQNKGFKAAKQDRDYKNLFYVGGSANPGGGMPMVTLSGMKAIDRLVAYDGR